MNCKNAAISNSLSAAVQYIVRKANSFLSKFMVKYNRKFSVSPEDDTPAFRTLDESINLDHILCIKENRMIIEDSAFSYCGKYYQLLKNGKKSGALPKSKITILNSKKIGVKAMYGNTKPSKDHPWRKSSNKKAIPHAREDLFYERENIEIDNILKDLFSSIREWL